MTDESVISLSAAREARGRPIRSYTVQIEHFAPGEEPAITVRGLGDDIREIDVRALNRDMLTCALRFSIEARDAGGQSTAVAFASVWTDGSVNTMADVELFAPVVRRLWLAKAVQMIDQSFGNLLDETHGPMPLAQPGDVD